MADWGLYGALRGTDDWKQKRSDAVLNIQAAEKRQAFATQQEQESMNMQEYMAKYTSAMEQLDVLEQDQERVQGAEKEARQEIVAGIAKYGGDLRKYMASGGVTALNAYKSNVLQSEEFQNAKSNKQNQASWLQARAKGNQFIKQVEVEVPGVDENGNEITTTQMMSMEEQNKMFDEGKINKLNYNGAEGKININAMDFKKTYKNALDRTNPNNYVSQAEVAELAITRGASEEQAYEKSRQYGEILKNGGQPWRWNSDDPSKLEATYDNMNAGIDKFNAGSANRREEFEYNKKMAAYSAELKWKTAQRKAEKAKNKNTFRPLMTSLNDGEGVSITPSDRKYMEEYYQVKPRAAKNTFFSESGKTYSGTTMMFGRTADQNNPQLAGDGVEMNMNNVEVISWGSGPGEGVVQHNGQKYVPVTMAIPEEEFDSYKFSKDAGSIYRNAFGSKTTGENFDGSANMSAYIVRTYLPIDDFINDNRAQEGMTKAEGSKEGANQQGAGGEDWVDVANRSDQMAQSLVDDGTFGTLQEARNALAENAGKTYGEQYDPNL